MQRHGAKGGIESPVTDMPAIVGAGFPRLRIPPPVLRFTNYAPTCRPAGALRHLCIGYSINLPPSAAKYTDCTKIQGRGIQRRGEVSKPNGLGNPTPTNSMVGWCLCFLSVQSAESVLIRDSDGCHMSPLWGFVVFGVCRRAINMSPRWGLNAAQFAVRYPL